MGEMRVQVGFPIGRWINGLLLADFHMVAMPDGKGEAPADALLPTEDSTNLFQQPIQQAQESVVIDLIRRHGARSLDADLLHGRKNGGGVNAMRPLMQQDGGRAQGELQMGEGNVGDGT